ncbi:MAG: tol-pal system-associated acyl-CoA thioesterase [Litoreibacter sp.]|nr:tol-pal system-associated acyl-CoA thioesterase [Litoreibacter sp.]MCY4336524.1 tol-pal system-associated acyl-CoA thioesterase [Litoreibacter sp.]
MTQTAPHHFTCRVYYEDTDLAGIVYYANYLKFIERARSEWVRKLGVDQIKMKQDGLVFAVRRVEADYLSPARFDDVLDVQTSLDEMTGTRIKLTQTVLRDEAVLFRAAVTLVCLSETGKPSRIPEETRAKLRAHD